MLLVLGGCRNQRHSPLHQEQPARRALPRRTTYHWQSPGPIASYLVENSVGNRIRRASPRSGCRWAGKRPSARLRRIGISARSLPRRPPAHRRRQVRVAARGVAGSIQRRLDRLTYGMTALLSSAAQQPISMREAIAKASGSPFLLIAAGRRIDETEGSELLPQRRSRLGLGVDRAGRESHSCARNRPAAVGVAGNQLPEPDAQCLLSIKRMCC